MDKEVLEVILKKSVDDSKVVRIIEMTAESALKKGENYNSTILRVTLKVVLGNGRVAKKSFIAKKENSGEAADQISNDYNLFKFEVSVYTNILRKMEYLMEEFGDTEGPLWCQLIHYSPADGIILLEDLKASGFNTVKRTEVQDLEHARLVLRSLGRYHAMAKVLEQRGFVSKDDYKPYVLLNDEVYIHNLLYGGIRALVKGMRMTWGEEWAETADKLSQISSEKLLKRIRGNTLSNKNTFKCLNHGDCWNNNLMFKYDWEGRPIGLRLVDFQIPHYNSPCVDVIYFMYSSINPKVRRVSYQSLVKLYHESLVSSLEKFGYKGSQPSLDNINDAMDSLTFFALSFFLAMFPIFQATATDGMDLEQVIKTNGEEGFNVSIYTEDGIKEKIGEEIKRLVES